MPPVAAQVTPEQVSALLRWRSDLAFFAETFLRIRTKSGDITPLRFNRAQRHAHAALEAQRSRTGKVRALVLKARQQGFSTYIAARYYAKASLYSGLQAYILTHEQEASETLFKMVDRFQRLSPVHPVASRTNVRELVFGDLDGGYAVGSAGTQAVGRSKTVQLLHGSEVAFWKNATDHFAGVVQTVPDLPGTEVILESTGNGPSGEFFERWQQAEAGIGDYQAIFVPWFWTEEYVRPVEPGFALDDEEAIYARAHQLSHEQMAWRRAKLAELKDPMLFMQEYPATAHEAFQSTGADSYIGTAAVLAARKNTVEAIGPLVLGVDPKREGADRFAMAWRRGRKVIKITADAAPVDTLTAATRVRVVIDQDKPERVFVDVGGNGGAICDLLRSWGYDQVREVNFGSSPIEPDRVLADGTKRPAPKNRRAEMWSASRDWLNDTAGVDIPDMDGLQADACAPGYSYDTAQRLVLESKDHIASRGVRSPDLWDAVALTFAEPVVEDRPQRTPRRISSGSWMG